MLKVQNLCLVLLMLCSVFLACDRIQEIVQPDGAPATETPETIVDPIMTEILPVYPTWAYAQPMPAPPATFTEAKDSGSAHGLGERTVYLNGIDHYFFYAVPAAIDAGEPVLFPTGMTIVKEIMDDTNTFVLRIAVMQKTEDPMYAAHEGWLYKQYERESETDAFVATAGDGTPNGSAGCYDCHAKAAHDSVFVTELLLELGRERLEAIQ